MYLYRYVFVMKPATHKQGATEEPPWSGLQKTIGEFEPVFTCSKLSLAAPHYNYKFGPHRGSNMKKKSEFSYLKIFSFWR